MQAVNKTRAKLIRIAGNKIPKESLKVLIVI
jgi:hypothetical protein